MKRTIRFGTFETNSSSVHSLVMCSKQEYNLFKSGDLLLDRDYDELVPKIAVDANEDDYNRYQTYDEFFNDGYYETFEQSYTSESGDEIVGFGYYGHD